MTKIIAIDAQTGKTLATLNNRGNKVFYNENYSRIMKGKHAFVFTMLATNPKANHFSRNNRLLVKIRPGVFEEFTIFHTFTNMKNEKTITATASYSSLETAHIIEPGTYTGTLQKIATDALAPTKYELGLFEDFGQRTIQITEPVGAYSFSIKLASEFNLEMDIRIEMKGNKFTARYVDFVKRIGPDIKDLIEYGENLSDIEMQEYTDRIATRLIGMGPIREDGSYLTSIAVDEEAFQRWNDEGTHITKLYRPETNDQNMTQARLDQLTKAELKKRIDSVVEYKVTAAFIEGAKYGSSLRVKNPKYVPPLYADARVIGVEGPLLNNKETIFTIGEVKTYSQEDILRTFKQLQAQYNMRVVRSEERPSGSPNKIWVQIVPAIDGKPATEVPHVWSTELNDWVKIAPTKAAEIGAETPAGAQVKADEALRLAREDISGVQDALDTLELGINTTFADGLIQEAEALAIEKYINSLQAEKADVDNRYTSLHGSAYLELADQDSLAAAKSQFDLSHIDLITGIQNAIADSKTTAQESATVDQLFDSYRLKLASMATAFEQAADKISAAKATEAKDAAKFYTDEQLKNFVPFIDYANKLDELQSQIDKNVTTWFDFGEPTTSNYPAVDWTTVEDRDVHLGDVYYDKSTGYAYRFTIEGGVHLWTSLKDSDITKALKEAAAAKDTADGKRRVFVNQPIPPYDVGDLWSQGPTGDLLRCVNTKIAGQVYAVSDFQKSAKYTDDTRAIEAEKNAKDYADEVVLPAAKNFTQEYAEKMIPQQPTPPANPIAGDLWIDTSNPSLHVWKRFDGVIWRKATATSLSELEGTLQSAQIAIDAINATHIADNAISAVMIQNEAVDVDKIGNGAITDVKLADLAVTAGKLAGGSVTEAKIGANAVTVTKIVDSAITNAKIAAGAVTEVKISDLAITNSKLANLAIDAAKLASGSVTETKIGTNAVTNSKLANLAVDAAKLANSAVTATKIANLAVGTAAIADAAITNAKIANLAVDTAQIASAAITSAKIANLAVGTAAIADASITNAKISNLSAEKINAGILSADRIGAQSITASKIASVSPNLLFDVDTFAQYAIGTQPPGSLGGSINAISDKYAYSGQKSLAHTSTAGNSYKYINPISNGAGGWARMKNGKRYIVSAYVMTESETPINVQLTIVPREYNSTTISGISTGTASRIISAADGWVRVSVLSNVINGVDPAMTYYIRHGDTGYTSYWSAFQMEEYISDTEPSVFAPGGAVVLDGGNLVANSVTSAHILAGTITAESGIIADAAITSAKIASLAVGTAAIANGAITNAKINDLDAGKITAGTIAADRIGANSITATHIAGKTITAAQIATGTLTANELAANSVTAAKIAAGAVTANAIAANSITSTMIATAGLDAGVIKFGTMSGSRILANSIDSSKIVTAGLDAAVIKSGAITGIVYRSGWGTSQRLEITSGQFIMTHNTTISGTVYTSETNMVNGYFTMTSSGGTLPYYEAQMMAEGYYNKSQIAISRFQHDHIEMRRNVANWQEVAPDRLSIILHDGYATVDSLKELRLVGAGNTLSVATEQIKLNGDVVGISGDKILYSSSGIYLQASQTIYPTKKLSECPNGWILVWSRYVNGASADSDWNYSYIPKLHAGLGGGAWMRLTAADVSATVPPEARKYAYFYDNRIIGHDRNRTGTESGQVLRYVLAW